MKNKRQRLIKVQTLIADTTTRIKELQKERYQLMDELCLTAKSQRAERVRKRCERRDLVIQMLKDGHRQAEISRVTGMTITSVARYKRGLTK